MERCCKECGVLKPITEFANAGVVNGVRYYRHKCKGCYVKFKGAYRKDKKSKLDEYKKTLSCTDCCLKDFRVMDFHHTDKNKEHSVGNMVKSGWCFETIMKEIAKCIPLCANCHRIRHYIENNGAKACR